MGNVNILVVEDEIIVAHDIKNCLEDLGYAVTGVAATGMDAIKKAEETYPDVILMDIALKGDMDGIEAGEIICKNLDIPLIYLTAYSDEKTIERAKVTQPFGFILKPFDEKTLKCNIEMTLYRHRIEKSRKYNGKSNLIKIFDNIPDAVIVTDSEGCIKHINPRAEKLTGLNKIDVVGLHINEILDLNYDSNKQMEDPVKKAIEKDVFFDFGESTVLTSWEGRQTPVDIMWVLRSRMNLRRSSVFFNIT